ncbi:MAG: inositol monophosphatase [Rhodobiaceae bacterium]|nr:inositol monophosphatase [Rhodobiaceae bacterium]
MMADMDRLATLLRAVATDIIMPRYQALGSGDIEEKSKGDFVTIADREAEFALTPELKGMVPDSIVVGEEATAADPSLLDAADTDKPIWYVDPIDGTSNFINGLPGFAIMVAFADRSEVRQSAIFFPVSGTLYMAEKGAGAFVQEAGKVALKLPRRSGPDALNVAHAAFYTKHFPPQWDAPLERLQQSVALSTNDLAAACEYTDIACGRKDLATYHRMLPWDHAPGSLILREVGGVARNIATGDDHRPAHVQGPHVLAATEPLWHAARTLMV